MPNIKPRDWIQVGNRQCVVAVVREPGHVLGDCEVVFNRAKPANLNVRWKDGKWEFEEAGGFSGYANNYPRLREFVGILKQGGPLARPSN